MNESLKYADGLIGLVTAIGLVPTLLLVGVAMFFIFREIRKNMSSFAKKLESQDKKIESIEKAVEDKFVTIETSIKYIERDFLTKEQHYKDIEGWKTEVQNLHNHITMLPLELVKVMQGMKGD